MKIKIYLWVVFIIGFYNCKNAPNKKNIELTENMDEVKFEIPSTLKIHPIEHASVVIEFDRKTIYLDPTLGAEPYNRFDIPNYVVITDIHGDHMNIETLEALDLSGSVIIAPQAVMEKLPENIADNVVVINNGELKKFDVFEIEAIPMYNLREEALKFHEKGRGNGYVFTFGNERVYFSGDTEDIPEMRALKNIDKAFVCMNLPYTMTVESAANAVLEFKPNQVYPYHYRGTGGLSDVAKFKKIINAANANIEVVQLDWYPKS